MTISETFPRTKPTILVVDDIAANRELLEAHLVEPHFRLCGACCESEEMPLLHLLAGIDGCVRHGRALAEHCSCGAPLRPFEDQEPAWTCHACGAAYAALDTGAIREREGERARADV